MTTLHHPLIGWIRTNRFHVLFVALVCSIAIGPHFPGTLAASIVNDTLISVVLLAAIGCLQFRKRGIVTTRWFGLFTLISGWIPMFLPSDFLSAAVALFRIGFLLVVTAALIYQVGVSRKVSLPVIIGAIDGYLLLGMVGGVAFAILDLLHPGSLHQSSGNLARPDYVYFSFITMLTIGYGDIVPVSIAARTVAMFLAIGGQMYIAILVATLVGKFIAAAQAEQA